MFFHVFCTSWRITLVHVRSSPHGFSVRLERMTTKEKEKSVQTFWLYCYQYSCLCLSNEEVVEHKTEIETGISFVEQSMGRRWRSRNWKKKINSFCISGRNRRSWARKCRNFAARKLFCKRRRNFSSASPRTTANLSSIVDNRFSHSFCTVEKDNSSLGNWPKI